MMRESPETSRYMHKLNITNPLFEPLYRRVIRDIRLPKGSRGLDVGCGIGLQAILLADEIGSEGEVIGLDISSEFLARAEKNIEEAGLCGRVSFKAGDMHKLPFADKIFDWLWSASCVGYNAPEPVPLLKETARVIKPGGKIALLIYSSQILLPGYPLLEAKLNATSAGIAPFTVDRRPGSHHMCILGWFRELGFVKPEARTYVHDIQAPLIDDIRDAVAALIDMRWGEENPELSPEDRDSFRKLTSLESPDCIMNRPDYYAFFTFSLFQAKIPG
jgi:demethylmenaquinone methyltransferase/2-methoxy-6-polyprenyl-1,4-benzoquinol methylase